MAVVAAFKRAFANGRHGPVKLVLKTLNADVAAIPGHALREMIRHDPNIILIERLLSRERDAGAGGVLRRRRDAASKRGPWPVGRRSHGAGKASGLDRLFGNG